MIRRMTVEEFDNIQIKQIEKEMKGVNEKDFNVYTEDELEEKIEVKLNEKEAAKIKRREFIQICNWIDVLKKQPIEYLEKILSEKETVSLTEADKVFCIRLNEEIKDKRLNDK